MQQPDELVGLCDVTDIMYRTVRVFVRTAVGRLSRGHGLPCAMCLSHQNVASKSSHCKACLLTLALGNSLVTICLDHRETMVHTAVMFGYNKRVNGHPCISPCRLGPHAATSIHPATNRGMREQQRANQSLGAAMRGSECVQEGCSLLASFRVPK